MEIFKLFGSVLVNNDKANKSISNTDSKARGLAKSLGGGIKTAAKWGAGIAVAAGAVGGALVAVANKSAATTDRIDKMSQRLGMTREGFQEWDYVLSQAGISIDSMQSGMKSLSQRMDDSAEGVGKGAELFEKLGISVTDTNGEFRDQEEVFNDTIRALQGMDDGVEKAAMAQELFGRSGQELLPLLNAEAESVDALKEKAHEMGLVLSDEMVDAGVEYTDTMDTMKRVGGAMFAQLGMQFMPMLTKLMNWFMTNMPAIQRKIKKVVDTVGPYVSTFVGFIQDKMPAIKKIASDAFDGITAAADKLKEVYVNGIQPAVQEWKDFWDENGAQIEANVTAVMDGITGAIQGVIGALVTALEKFVELNVAASEYLGYDILKPEDVQDVTSIEANAIMNGDGLKNWRDRKASDGSWGAYDGVSPVLKNPQKIIHEGIVIVKGVNDKEQLVAVVKERISQEMVDDDRRIADRPRITGGW